VRPHVGRCRHDRAASLVSLGRPAQPTTSRQPINQHGADRESVTNRQPVGRRGADRESVTNHQPVGRRGAEFERVCADNDDTYDADTYDTDLAHATADDSAELCLLPGVRGMPGAAAAFAAGLLAAHLGQHRSRVGLRPRGAGTSAGVPAAVDVPDAGQPLMGMPRRPRASDPADAG
jgi:hypothetical protein